MLEFPDPVSLLAGHQLAALPLGWTRKGAEFEAVLPHNRLAKNGDLGDYSPAYIGGEGSSLDDVAYGMYLFSPGEFSTDTTIHVEWDEQPENSGSAWIGVASFERNSWEWFFPGTSNQVLLSSFAPYRRQSDGLMLVTVALIGEAPAKLGKLWLSTELPADTIYAIPAETEVAKGDKVRVTVFTNETAVPLLAISVRILVTEGDQLVAGSMNIGEPGGEAGYPDGVWAESQTDSVVFTGYSPGSEAPAGFVALDFAVAPLFAQDIPDATGALFNFELTVNQSTELAIQRRSEHLKRTYYGSLSDTDDHYWANDTNEGQPGIHVTGSPTAVLIADPLAGNTPLEVAFDASQSFDEPPGSIIRYEFDFGEGDGYENYSLNPLASHLYQWHGERTAKVRVTDNAGSTGVASVIVSPVRYDELEDNDSIELASSLPGDQFSGFRGNVGKPSPNFIPYDGDDVDYYLLNLEPNVYYRFFADVGTEPLDGSLELLLFNQAGEDVAIGTTGWDLGECEYLDYRPQADEVPMYLLVANYYANFDYRLTAMRWPPYAGLFSDVYSGELPFTITLNAWRSGDMQGEDIARYEFDFGDGSGFIDNGDNPEAEHTYTTEDLYYPKVRVFDDDGNFDIEKLPVYAGQEYDEIEPNNYWDGLQRLSMATSTPIRGSCGSKYDYDAHEYVYRGYDGSSSDYFYFYGSPGNTVLLSLEYDSSTGNLDLYLLNSDRAELAASESEDDHEELSYVLQPEDVGKLYVLVTNHGYGGEYSDYALTGYIERP